MNEKDGDCGDAKQGDRSIVEFRKVLHDILQPCHDDIFLLRWLKAQNFDLIEAEKMIRKSFEFRRKMGADTILKSYELPEVYKEFPVTQCLGFDKENCVVRLLMAGFCDCKGYVNSLSIVDLAKLCVYFLEKDLQMLREKKKELGKLDERITFIIDFNGFRKKRITNIKVISAVNRLITMFEDNYPETLKAAYLINAPYFFDLTFDIFKRLLKPVILSKIKILSADEWKEEIFKVIDKKQVPSFMGGDLDENPNCSKLIHRKFKIPLCYYLEHKVCADDSPMKEVIVKPLSDFRVFVEVKYVGSILKWIFRTKYYNIKFGLFYRLKNGEPEKLIPVKSVECQLLPEENGFICELAGTYVLYFDNILSLWHEKQLSYKVEVESPGTSVNPSD